MTYEMALQDVRYDGIAIGEECKAVDAARNFLAMGLSVAQVTRLPPERVRELADSR